MEIKSAPLVELPGQVEVINVGLPMFRTALHDQGVEVTDVEWRIPGGGEPDVVAALTRLYGPAGDLIETANGEVVRRLNEGVALLVGIESAADVVPDMGARTILHCGPAISWERMCDPLQRSVRAAVLAEGWADSRSAATELVTSGEVELRPANEHSTVVPMATAIGPTAPVYVVENEKGGVQGYSSLNQGPGEVAWFGVDTDAAVERLRFLRDSVSPILAVALAGLGPVDVFSLAAQGVPMGDDVHMRVQATTNLFLRDLLPHLMGSQRDDSVEVASFLSGNHLMFLNVAMAGAKSLVRWAGDVDHSSIVTTMSRNGTDYGIRLSGADAGWFLAPSPPVQDALYYPDQGPETSAPDIGDSAVLELIGLGGPAAANSPAVAGFLGGRMSDAIRATRNMQKICAGESPRFRLPILDNVGTPVGVDVRRVVESGITPAVNTGIVHINDGSGQVGAGVAWAPIECFVDALLDLDSRLSTSG